MVVSRDAGGPWLGLSSASGRTYEICQHVYCVRKVQREYDALGFVWSAAAFPAIKLLVEIDAGEDATEHTANPRLHNISKRPKDGKSDTPLTSTTTASIAHQILS